MGEIREQPVSSSTTDRRGEWLLVVVAISVGLLMMAVSLLHHGGDIAGLIRLGDGETVAKRTAHVEDVLGREVATITNLGHDGSMFFLQALDPFYLSPSEHAVHLDRPIYRAQRMLYPTIARVGGLLPAEAILWMMGLTNVTALALGTVAAARLSTQLGGSRWLGLAFLLNPGVIFEFDISGAGVVAFAAALWGTVMVKEGRHRHAIAWFTAAVLAREVMLLYLAGVCLYRLWRTHRIPWLLGTIPALSAIAWAGYIRLRLDSPDGVNEIQEFGPPFQGMLDSVENWLTDPVELGVIAGLIVVMPLLILRTWQRPNALAFGAIGFVLMAILMTQHVWWSYINISRATAPIMTAYIITAFSTQTSPKQLRRKSGDDHSDQATSRDA